MEESNDFLGSARFSSAFNEAKFEAFFSVPKNPIFSGIAGNLIFLIFSNWFYSGSMELQLTSATCLKIFIFPTFQNQKSILLSFLSNSLLRSVCFYPLHYFFLCLVKFPGCGDLASWNKLYCCDFEFSIPGNLSFSGFWLGFIFLQFLTGS